MMWSDEKKVSLSFLQAEGEIEEGLIGRLDWVFTARIDKPYVYAGRQN